MIGTMIPTPSRLQRGAGRLMACPHYEGSRPDPRVPPAHGTGPEERQERILHDLFGFRMAPRDPEGHTVEARAVALPALLRQALVLAPGVRVGWTDHGSSPAARQSL